MYTIDDERAMMNRPTVTAASTGVYTAADASTEPVPRRPWCPRCRDVAHDHRTMMSDGSVRIDRVLDARDFADATDHENGRHGRNSG